MNANATYPSFEYEASELKKFIEAYGIFSILLNCGDIIHYQPSSASDFRQWLRQHRIMDLKSNDL